MRTRHHQAQDQGDRHLGQASTSTAPARAEIETGIGFLDHMLEQVARHGLIDLTIARQGRPPHRPAPHDRGCRHRARPGAPPGARRARRHHPLCRRAPADGRGADARRDRHLRPALSRLEGRASRATRSASSTPSSCASSSRRSPRTPGSRSTSRRSTARTTTTSPRPASRRVARALRAAVAIDPRAGRPRALDQGSAQWLRCLAMTIYTVLAPKLADGG